MQHKTVRFTGLALVLVFGFVLGACGGGGTTTASHFQDPNADPGVVGDVGSSPASVMDRIQPFIYQPAGISAEAPLGTNPPYDVLPGTAAVSTHTAAKAGSELTPGQTYAIEGVTIALSGRRT